ncbi:hypothetical protein Vretimale_5620 [Volvox reticuliferus]|uniref:YdbS-like PH domain-containing protein n=1 Tax=Volvox reticuliferus TaxID=1737510 RepID=A0A8J4LK65_9CHLO|nr:hypothetical protein Vretimale_5620 [Volvox reticuliferus]
MFSSLQANSVSTSRPSAGFRQNLAYSCTQTFRSRCSISRTKLLGSHSQRTATTRASTEDSAAAAAPATAEIPSASTSSDAAADATPEVVFYEGPGSNAELILSLVLLPTLIYAPLSIASIGRRLWISFKFTNKRLVIVNTSPLFKRTIEIAYKNIKEIRTGPRGFGLWGDMVVFLRDGSRIELTGLEKYKEIEEHINRCIYTL